MAFFKYSCSKCNINTAFYGKSEKTEREVERTCSTCSSSLVRVPSSATQQSKEVVDTGFMAKAVERYTEAENIYKDYQKSQVKYHGLEDQERHAKELQEFSEDPDD
jgi:hypothetical protein